MFIIDLRNALVSEYRFSVMDNENVDKVGIISQFTQYSDYSIYLKVESEDRTYVDKIAIANEDVSVEDGALVVKWTMGRVSTQCKQINLQLQFEKEIEGKQYTAQSRIVSLTLRDTINVDEEMSHIYPQILEGLRHDIDQEHATNVAQQEEINANTQKLSGIENGAQVNVIEGININGQAVAPQNKVVSFNVPTKTSDIQNDSDYTTKSYVDQQIENIEMRSDVVDIVGTYADLQAYDTSSLAPNSLIKVINDETHSHETTYYRWVITQNVGAWVFVASEGAHYTKSETDTLLAGKQDKCIFQVADITELASAVVNNAKVGDIFVSQSDDNTPFLVSYKFDGVCQFTSFGSDGSYTHSYYYDDNDEEWHYDDVYSFTMTDVGNKIDEKIANRVKFITTSHRYNQLTSSEINSLVAGMVVVNSVSQDIGMVVYVNSSEKYIQSISDGIITTFKYTKSGNTWSYHNYTSFAFENYARKWVFGHNITSLTRSDWLNLREGDFVYDTATGLEFIYSGSIQWLMEGHRLLFLSNPYKIVRYYWDEGVDSYNYLDTAHCGQYYEYNASLENMDEDLTELFQVGDWVITTISNNKLGYQVVANDNNEKVLMGHFDNRVEIYRYLYDSVQQMWVFDSHETYEVGSVRVQTTAPSSNNSSGNTRFVYLENEPATKYSGYIYMIKEED